MKSLSPERWISIFLIVLVSAAFSGVAQNGFVNYDDPAYVQYNDHVQKGLTKETVGLAFTKVFAANWHPLTMLSHMLDCQIYGLQPAGHHLTNLLFHIASTLLLFLFLRETTGRRWESALVAAFFGIHPLHVESVAWISERKDVLSGFFGILTLLMYARYARNPNLVRYLSTLVLFILGLLSKPMLVTLPLIFFLLDFWPLARLTISDESDAGHSLRSKILRYRLLALEKIPFLFFSLLSGIMTIIAQSGAGAMSTLDSIPLRYRLDNALVSYQRYMEKALWPDNLSIFYPYSFHPLPDYQVIGAAVFLALVTVAVILSVRRHPYVGMGWLWFLITLLPVIGIVQVGLQSMADRYMYLPSIGIYVIVVWSLSSLSQSLPHRQIFASALSVAVLAFLSLATWHQVRHWESTKTLFQHAAIVTAQNWQAHNIIGGILLAEGNLSAAETEFTRALTIFPNHSDSHVGYSAVLEKRGQMERALAHIQAALRINRQNARAYIHKGNVLQKMGKKEQALAAYSAAEGLIDDNSWIRNTLGKAFAEVGRTDRALAQFYRALVLSPKRADTNNNIGTALNLQGRPDDAFRYLMAAITLQPDFPEAYNNAGIAMQKLGNLEKAAYFFSAALVLRPDYEKAKGNLRRLAAMIAASSGETKKK